MAHSHSGDGAHGLELTDKELEELQTMVLSTGLSDSIIALEQEKEKGDYKARPKRGIPPPPPKNRDAMGNYIAPEGGKLLSGGTVPGPQNYEPQYDKIHKSAPMYSLGECFTDRGKFQTPGPKYNTSGSLSWGRCKRITIRHKHPELVDVKPGPASYKPRDKAILRKAPRFSIGKKEKGKITGYVCPLAMKPNKDSPGPKYDFKPDLDRPKPVTFGTKPEEKKMKKQPGPGKYWTRGGPAGPSWKIGHKTTDPFKPTGPGFYNLPSYIGKSGAAKINGRPVAKEILETPGPARYRQQGYDLSEPGFTLTYRGFGTDVERIFIKNKNPAPYTYNPNVNKKKAPAYSLSEKVRPTYPSSVYASLTTTGPGPKYRPPSPATRATSFGTARKDVKDKGPGPADYTSSLYVKRQAPVYSLGKKCDKKPSNFSIPGPNAYKVVRPQKSKAYTMGVKVKRPEGTNVLGPGPAAYTPCRGTCESDCGADPGVTLKSRHTPKKYSGLAQAVRLQPPNSALLDVPLLA